MRTANDLNRNQLAEIVESIQGILYLDLDQRGAQYWNPEKQWSGADVCEHMGGLLDKHGLVPQRRQSADGSSYVLYDFDAEKLVATDVYPNYPDAADDAAGLDNVLILRLAVPVRDSFSTAESVTVRLQSEEFGAEDFQYDDLDDALAAIRRLYHECRKQDDRVERQISLLVGLPQDAADMD